MTITGSSFSFYFRRIPLRNGIGVGEEPESMSYNLDLKNDFIFAWGLVTYTIELLLLLLCVVCLTVLSPVSVSVGLWLSECPLPSHSFDNTCYLISIHSSWKTQIFLLGTITVSLQLSSSTSISLCMLRSVTFVSNIISSWSLCQSSFLIHCCLHLNSASDSLQTS